MSSCREALTGVKAPIVVLLGRRFPMIGAHKVLAAYACLVPRLVTGHFDPAHDRAVWPSTGNYCRGGVAISRILGCRGVAVLPAGMSRERFDWLSEWVADPADIIRTPGTESNVKEIYDKCAELARDAEQRHPQSVLRVRQLPDPLLLHRRRLRSRVLAAAKARTRDYRLAAFVSATGSAGTIAAGDYLKSRHGAKIAAVEALECPTMLCNGYGEHNIQGIGDKHIPLIHNVMNTDLVVGVSDRASDSLNLLFGSNVGRSYLAGRRKIDPDVVRSLRRHRHLGAGQYRRRHQGRQASRFRRRRRGHDGGDRQRRCSTPASGEAFWRGTIGDGFDEVNAGEIFSRHLEGIVDDHVLELTHFDRKRIFNLGYFTWVEQQGVSIDDFERAGTSGSGAASWTAYRLWDRLIDEFNAEVGVGRAH